MSQAVEYTSWPLSASLTRSVVNYLDVYRMIITLLLAGAHFSGLMDTGSARGYPALASAVLLVALSSSAAFAPAARPARGASSLAMASDLFGKFSA